MTLDSSPSSSSSSSSAMMTRDTSTLTLNQAEIERIKNYDISPITGWVEVVDGQAHNLKGVNVAFPREHITMVTGVSGSGKSSLVFDTILQEAKHRFFSTLSHFDRGLFTMGERAAAREVSGLSLAIALEQSETAPSSRATVGTLSDVGELLGVLWARFSEQLCPEHQLICGTAATPAHLSQKIYEQKQGKHVALIAPIAFAKKGLFKSELQQAQKHGFESVLINATEYSSIQKPKQKYLPSKPRKSTPLSWYAKELPLTLKRFLTKLFVLPCVWVKGV